MMRPACTPCALAPFEPALGRCAAAAVVVGALAARARAVAGSATAPRPGETVRLAVAGRDAAEEEPLTLFACEKCEAGARAAAAAAAAAA